MTRQINNFGDSKISYLVNVKRARGKFEHDGVFKSLEEATSSDAFKQKFINDAMHRDSSNQQMARDSPEQAMDSNLDTNFYQDNLFRVSETVKRNIVGVIMKKITN